MLVALVAAALVLVLTHDGDDARNDARSDVPCDPAAPFERPPPRGFAYAPETPALVERGYARTRRHTAEFRREDFEVRPVAAPGGAGGVAISIRTPEGWTSEDLELAIFAVASEDPEARPSRREVPLGSVSGRLIRLEIRGDRTLMLVAASGCRLFMVQGDRLGTLRELAAHLVAGG